MQCGLTLTEQSATASMLCGIDVDVNAIGADVNYYGMDLDVTQQVISGGAYLSRGNMTGVRVDLAAIGNIDHLYAVRIASTVAMTANTEGNQLYGGTMAATASGAFTLTLHDGLVGAQIGVGVGATVVDVTGGIVAALFINASNILIDCTSDTYGIYVKSGAGYMDYGVNVQVEGNNVDAGMRVHTTDSAILPIGLKLESTSGSITKQIEFSGSGAAGIYTGTADPNATLSAEDGSIYLRTGTTTANTTLYVCTGTTNWSALGTG